MRPSQLKVGCTVKVPFPMKWRKKVSQRYYDIVKELADRFTDPYYKKWYRFCDRHGYD